MYEIVSVRIELTYISQELAASTFRVSMVE